MQSLDVISVNLWHILISLANLALMFLIIKKLLWKPVTKMFAARQGEIDEQYAAADRAAAEAETHKEAWEEKHRTAEAEADAIIKTAAETARHRADGILAEADERAAGIVRRAEEEARLERRRATEGIRTEIVDVSTALAEKMLGREVNAEDHRALIDSFIEEIGDGND